MEATLFPPLAFLEVLLAGLVILLKPVAILRRAWVDHTSLRFLTGPQVGPPA